MSSVITKEGGESKVWRQMKDWTDECHSPIPMQAIFGSRKTPNPASDIKETPRETIMCHLNHLINHFNHLNLIGLQDLSQRWQNNTSVFCKHCRKLEADLDSRAEVLQSSSVLLTSIQAETVSISVCDVIHIKCGVIDTMSIKCACPVNQNPASPVPASGDSRNCS